MSYQTRYNKRARVVQDETGYATTERVPKVPAATIVDDVVLMEQRLATMSSATSSLQTQVNTLDNILTVSPVIIPYDSAYAVEITGQTTLSAPTIGPNGSGGDIGFTVKSKGNGVLTLTAPQQMLKHPSGGRYINIKPSLAGTPEITTEGVTNTPLLISTSGNANISLFPGSTGLVLFKKFICSVTATLNQSIVVGDASPTFGEASLVAWDTINVDPFSAFSNDNDSITVPVAGIYRITAALKASDTGSILVYFANNGNQIGNGEYLSLNTGSYGGFEISKVVQLAAGSPITVKAIGVNAGDILQASGNGLNDLQIGESEFIVEYISS